MAVVLTIIIDDDPQNKDEAYRQAVHSIRDYLIATSPSAVRVDYKSAIGTPLDRILSQHLLVINQNPSNEYHVALFLRHTAVKRQVLNEIEMIYTQLNNRLQIFCTQLPEEGYSLLQTTLHDYSQSPKVAFEVNNFSPTNVERIQDRLLKRVKKAVDALEAQATQEIAEDPQLTERESYRQAQANHDDLPPETPKPPLYQPRDEPVPAMPQRMSTTLKRSSPVSNKLQIRLENEGVLKAVVYNYRPAPGADVDPYSYDETENDTTEGVTDSFGTWVIAGASIRGRGHQNKGTHRDDAFKIQKAGQWHIMALSDGAGSAEYSRITAHESVRVAVETIAQFAQPVSQTPTQIEQRMHNALQKAITEVHRIQEMWNNRLNVDKSKTYCTLLILIHQPLENGGCVIGTLHVGDGVICGVNSAAFNLLTQGDHGADASTTHFVLSFPLNKLLTRPQTHTIDRSVDVFVLMSDGIEDDLKPSTEQYIQGERMEQNAERFIRALQGEYLVYPEWQDWGVILEDVISYERQNSNDDRTLVVLARRSAREENG